MDGGHLLFCFSLCLLLMYVLVCYRCFVSLSLLLFLDGGHLLRGARQTLLLLFFGLGSVVVKSFRLSCHLLRGAAANHRRFAFRLQMQIPPDRLISDLRGFPNFNVDIKRQEGLQATANPPTNMVDFRGFDSSVILLRRGGIPRPIGDFPESLSQAILVGIMLAGRLGVLRSLVQR